MKPLPFGLGQIKGKGRGLMVLSHWHYYRPCYRYSRNPFRDSIFSGRDWSFPNVAVAFFFFFLCSMPSAICAPIKLKKSLILTYRAVRLRSDCQKSLIEFETKNGRHQQYLLIFSFFLFPASSYVDRRCCLNSIAEWSCTHVC